MNTHLSESMELLTELLLVLSMPLIPSYFLFLAFILPNQNLFLIHTVLHTVRFYFIEQCILSRNQIHSSLPQTPSLPL